MLKAKNIILAVLLFLPLLGAAQSYQYCRITMTELLQYQATKARHGGARAPFKKRNLKRVNVHEVISSDDGRRLWNYHCDANLSYDKTAQPLYRLFRMHDLSSLAIIDRPQGNDNAIEIVFWSKRYYLAFTKELRSIGFSMHQHGTNILQFRRPGTSIGVDITVESDVYLVKVGPLPSLAPPRPSPVGWG